MNAKFVDDFRPVMADGRCPISMGVLSKCENDALFKLLHQLVDGICGQICIRYQDYMKTWALHEWWEVNDVCQRCIKEAIKESWTKDELLSNIEDLSDEQKQTVIEVIQARHEDLRKHFLSTTNQISYASLTDFDWQMKLAMSSDKLSNVQEPLLAVDLDIKQGDKQRGIALEMNKTELEKLITSLEAANKVVQQLKS